MAESYLVPVPSELVKSTTTIKESMEELTFLELIDQFQAGVEQGSSNQVVNKEQSLVEATTVW